MDNYIRFEDATKKSDFVNLAFTTINVDMASREDRKNICKKHLV